MQNSPASVPLLPNFNVKDCMVGWGYVNVEIREVELAEFLDDTSQMWN